MIFDLICLYVSMIHVAFIVEWEMIVSMMCFVES